MRFSSLKRRRLLQGGGALAASAAGLWGCPAPGPEPAPHAEPGPTPEVFVHGVASFDPTATTVLLWTRITTQDQGPVQVEWEVARDADLAVVLARGTLRTDAARDFTVAAEVTGLEPRTTYYYRFTALGRSSPVGRTRTLPDGATQEFTIAFVCCASYGHGTFVAYERLLEHPDIDLVVHLGDYIYEVRSEAYGKRRPLQPTHACVTLDDYRLRYRHYREDKDLAAAHRMFPFAVLWDDHEFANNAAMTGAKGHKPAYGDWPTRRDAARQAFLEYLLVRAPGGENTLHRRLPVGDLADILIVDGRMGDKTRPAAPDDRMLGPTQEAWLRGQLQASSARHCIVAQQLSITPLLGIDYQESWDGYPKSRARLLETIRAFGRASTLCVSGDIHAAVASVLQTAAEPGVPTTPVAVEYIVPSVTSPCPFPRLNIDNNPHFAYLDTRHHGFLLLHMNHERAEATFHHFKARADSAPVWFVGKRFVTRPGAVGLSEV